MAPKRDTARQRRPKTRDKRRQQPPALPARPRGRQRGPEEAREAEEAEEAREADRQAEAPGNGKARNLPCFRTPETAKHVIYHAFPRFGIEVANY